MFLSLPKLNRQTATILNRIVREAASQGIGIYLAGGIVRDTILKKMNCDLDIVVESDAIVFAKEFAKKERLRLVAYPEFKTATLFLKSGQRIDFASSRKEYYRKKGALPIISRGSLKDDLFRRDFSINAMALNINNSGKGELIDLFNGYEDLKKRKIRVLHEKSFLDDPTRILRAVRYEQRLGFSIERKTLTLLKKALKLNIFNEISKDRFLNELKKILNEGDVCPIVKRLDELNILLSVNEELDINLPVLRLIQRNVAEEKSRIKKLGASIWFLCFMGMLEGNEQGVLDSIGIRFNLGKEKRKSLLQINDTSLILKKLTNDSRKPSENFQLLSGLTEEVLCYIWCRSSKENIRVRLKQFLCDRDVRLSIKGEDIKKMGARSGRQIGEIMNTIFLQKIDRSIKTRKQEIGVAKFLIESN
ncbi:MAG: CCA tRNA nucleotidyltransferase [Candidatus Omnitrophota bacterium]